MTLRINGSTSGYTEIDAPAVAGSNTLVLPGGNGSADQVLATNGSGTLSFVDRGRMVLETAKASTSGTAIDFTGIPSWVKRVTVMFNGVSTNGSTAVLVQVGTSGGVETTGYSNIVSFTTGTTSVGAGASSSGISTAIASASAIRSGALIFSLFSGNTWSVFGNVSDTANTVVAQLAGIKGLSGTLDRIRITALNGTDTFDAGSINLLLEG